MAWIIETLANLPNAVYTILLTLVLLYWLFVRLGVIDASGLHPAAPHKSIAAFLNQVGLAGAPVTVAASLLVGSAWIISLISRPYLQTVAGYAGTWTLLADILLLVAAFGLALLITRVGLARLLQSPQAIPVPVQLREKPTAGGLIGSVCYICSGRADERIGEAEYESDDGEIVKLHVRCQAPAWLKRGEAALITEYDQEKALYWVEPYLDPLV